MADREPQTINPQLGEITRQEPKPTSVSRRQLLQTLLNSIGVVTLAAGCTGYATNDGRPAAVQMGFSGDQPSGGDERQDQQPTRDIRVWMERTGSAVPPVGAILIVKKDKTPAVQDPNAPADDGNNPMNYALNAGDMVTVLEPHPGLGSNYVNGYVRVVSNGENGWVNIKNLEFKDER